MDERFLVTGSEGCIGSWIAKNLVEDGHTCIGLDLVTDARRLRRILSKDGLRAVKLIAGDITQEDVLQGLLEKHGITRIIHLAALQIPFVRHDPIRGALVNVAGTMRIFEAARRSHGQVQGVVYASSAAVFGPEDGTEEQRNPRTLYGVFKARNEDCAKVYWQDFGLTSMGLRPWAVFGPGRDQGLTAAPTLAMQAAVLGMPYRIPFGGRLDLQYADDVAKTFIQAALAAPDGASVHNLRGTIVSVDEVITAIEEAWPEATDLITRASEPIPIRPELDDSTLRALLGDVPRTDFKDAVRRTVGHFAQLVELGELKRDSAS